MDINILTIILLFLGGVIIMTFLFYMLYKSLESLNEKIDKMRMKIDNISNKKDE